MFLLDYNKLDKLFYINLINESKSINPQLIRGNSLFKDFDKFTFNLFLSLYKINIRLIKKHENVFFHSLLNNIISSSNYKVLRLRTRGNRHESFIAFKLLIDNLLESFSKKDFLENIKKEIHQKEINYNIDEMDLEKDFTKKELENIDKILDFLDNANKKNITDIDNLRKDLLKEIYSLLEQNKNLLDKNIDSLEDNANLSSFLEEMVNQNEKNKEKKEEISNEDDIYSSIKDDFEKRIASNKSKLEINIKDKNNSDFLLEMDNKEGEIDKALIEEGRLSGNKSYEFNKKISKSDEEHIRSVQKVWKKGLNNKHFNYEENFESEINKIPYIDKLEIPKSLSEISEKIDSFNKSIETIGINKKSLNNLDFEEVISLYKRIEDRKFIDFINKVGRGRKAARIAQLEKSKGKSIAINRESKSDRIDYLIDDEYINLGIDIEEFEDDFYDRFLQMNLQTTSLIDKKEKIKGPIILCYDGSGSMDGAKIRETRAQILSILEIAKMQKRKLVLIQFAAASEPLYIKELNPNYISSQDILEILDTFICGGTDFVNPLEKAIEYILMDKNKKSDILFITDGLCDIPDNFLEKFNKLKKIREFKLYTIIIYSFTYKDYGAISKISDMILDIREKDINKWDKSIGKKLFESL